MKPTILLALTAALVLTACGGTTSSGPDTTSPMIVLGRSAVDSSGMVTLKATASDNVRVTKVEFYQGSALLGTDTAAPFTSPSIDISTTRTNFTAKAYDAAGNVGTSATYDITTLYQGDWAWALADSAGTIVESGAAFFFDEATASKGLIAGGIYQNQAKTRTGFSLMGPIGTAGALEVAFTADTNTNTPTPYLIGVDEDGALGTYQGKATVEGSATTFDSAGNTGPVYALAMLQTSTIGTLSLGAKSAAIQSARALASAYATSHPLQAMKVNPATVKNAASFLNRR